MRRNDKRLSAGVREALRSTTVPWRYQHDITKGYHEYSRQFPPARNHTRLTARPRTRAECA